MILTGKRTTRPKVTRKNKKQNPYKWGLLKNHNGVSIGCGNRGSKRNPDPKGAQKGPPREGGSGSQQAKIKKVLGTTPDGIKKEKVPAGRKKGFRSGKKRGETGVQLRGGGEDRVPGKWGVGGGEAERDRREREDGKGTGVDNTKKAYLERAV